MLKVGITGGIGSGKSTACRIFESLGIPVYDADTRARHLMNTDEHLKDTLKAYFGNDIYEDGILNRRKLSDMIFNNKTALGKVNSSVHPAVARDFAQWCEQHTAPYVLEESAILFESHMTRRFDKIIVVTAPETIRIKRVCSRDCVSPETVRVRMDNQWPDEKKIPLADYVIYNDDILPIEPQVMDIHQQLFFQTGNPV